MIAGAGLAGTKAHRACGTRASTARWDVGNASHPLLRRHIWVEHWANALHQPRAAAWAMLGRDGSFGRLPYFYTDQYDLGMEYTGNVEPGGYDPGGLPW